METNYSDNINKSLEDIKKELEAIFNLLIEGKEKEYKIYNLTTNQLDWLCNVVWHEDNHIIFYDSFNQLLWYHYDKILVINTPNEYSVKLILPKNKRI